MKKVILVLSVCAALIAVWGCKQENTNVKQLECARKISVEVGLPMALAAEQNSFIVSDFKDAKGMIKVFNMETGKLKYQLTPKGEARDEVLEVSNFELLKDNGVETNIGTIEDLFNASLASWKNDWLLDSGETCHMNFKRDFFE